MEGHAVASSHEAFIRIEGLRKVYRTLEGGEVLAIDDVSFDIHQGEFLSIVGASGCGKTTLLKMLAGILAITGGAIRVNGRPLQGPQKDIGMVFQSPVLMQWRKVIENVMLPIYVFRRNPKDYYPRAYELLKLVDLTGFEDKYPRELSGGMQQRTSLCRALIHDPSLLLMDEPFGALDAMTREEMWGQLLKVYEEKRKTVVFITHNILEAVFLAHRVVVLSRRPARVQEIVKIDLPRPRHLEMTTSPELAGYVTHIREQIGIKKF